MVMVPRLTAAIVAALLSPAQTHAFTSTSIISSLPRSVRSAALSTTTTSFGRTSFASSITANKSIRPTTRSLTIMSSSINNVEGATIKRIGIIGGGAAGLATARAFLRANKNNDDDGTKQKKKVQFEVTVLETRNSVGGIWKYDDDDNDDRKKSRPMYRNLRTNLPKELMAFREFPWGAGDGAEPSYVTHRQVHKYLEDYATKFDLLKNIRFGCRVDHLKVVCDDGEHKHEAKEGADELDCDSWPQISLKWTDNTDNQSHHQTFDNICICNGHYDLPSNPPLRGLENFPGRVMHAIEYDTPTEFAGKTVLCVGARASGADIAREIGSVAKRVYLSDSSCNAREEFGAANVVVSMPRTQSVDKDGGIRFFSSESNGSNDEEWTLNDVDVIIFCSGYDYAFPFIDGESNLELENVAGERRVRPVYEQLWHAQYPSLSFVGLPHSVVPFPLFEIQSTAVVSQLISRVGSVGLPSLSERLVAAENDANSGGPVTPGRVQDTHFLGSYQWDYCRNVAKRAGVYNDDMENYIATNKALYDRSGKERKGVTPGGDDVYRETRFRRKEKEQSYEILHSEIKFANPTVKT